MRFEEERRREGLGRGDEDGDGDGGGERGVPRHGQGEEVEALHTQEMCGDAPLLEQVRKVLIFFSF